MGCVSVAAPPHNDAAKIGGEGEKRQHQDARCHSRCGQIFKRIDSGGVHCVNLLGDFHRPKFRSDAGADAAADHQTSDDRPGFFDNGENHDGRKE